jgi:hypothetical protein
MLAHGGNESQRRDHSFSLHRLNPREMSSHRGRSCSSPLMVLRSPTLTTLDVTPLYHNGGDGYDPRHRSNSDQYFGAIRFYGRRAI